MTKTLVDLLKIATDRKLSQIELEEVRKKGEVRRGSPKEYSETKLYSIGDQIIKEETRYWPGLVVSQTSYYTSGGLLMRKDTEETNLSGKSDRKKSLIYSPPGRFFGEKNERYRNVIHLIKLKGDKFIVTETDPEIGNLRPSRLSSMSRNSVISPKSKRPLRENKLRLSQRKTQENN